MGRVNRPQLSASERSALEEGLKTGKSHAFRMRCQVILLKSSGRKSDDVGEITGMTYVSVNSWVKRYKAEGIKGLDTKPGRGAKPKMSTEADRETVLKSIKANRQRVATAKAEWEESSGKSVGLSTFKTFLKALAEDING